MKVLKKKVNVASHIWTILCLYENLFSYLEQGTLCRTKCLLDFLVNTCKHLFFLEDEEMIPKLFVCPFLK